MTTEFVPKKRLVHIKSGSLKKFREGEIAKIPVRQETQREHYYEKRKVKQDAENAVIAEQQRVATEQRIHNRETPIFYGLFVS